MQMQFLALKSFALLPILRVLRLEQALESPLSHSQEFGGEDEKIASKVKIRPFSP